MKQALEAYCKTLNPLWNTGISRTEAEGFFEAGFKASVAEAEKQTPVCPDCKKLEDELERLRIKAELWKQDAIALRSTYEVETSFNGKNAQPKLEDWGYGPHESHSSQPKAEKQGSVAWRWIPSEVWGTYVLSDDHEKAELAKEHGIKVEPLYTHPQPKQPLTDEQIDDIWNRYCDEMGEASINDAHDIARAIEAAHDIKE
jgi:hypothetical protein